MSRSLETHPLLVVYATHNNNYCNMISKFQIVTVAICLITFEVHMNIFVIIKVKIRVLMNLYHVSIPQSCWMGASMVKGTKELLKCLKTIVLFGQMPKSSKKMYFKMIISHCDLYCCVEYLKVGNQWNICLVSPTLNINLTLSVDPCEKTFGNVEMYNVTVIATHYLILHPYFWEHFIT